jgi:hypothetical protein
MFRSDRIDVNQGGGVCIYVRNDLKSNEILNKKLTNLSIEQIWCIIDTGREHILIGCIYRPGTIRKNGITLNKQDHDTRDRNIEKSIAEAYNLTQTKKVNGVIIAGDFKRMFHESAY